MRALITGVTGQDGSYLAELLLGKGYEVHGTVRRSSTETLDRVAHLAGRLAVHQADLLDQTSLDAVVRDVRPDEVYNLAAMSFVPTSWSQPVLTGEFTAIGVTRVLEAVRAHAPGARFYQASSSEMFGKVRETPQTERTPFHPRSPYGVAKAYGHWITVNYRESYGLFACSGILFNHECVSSHTPILIRKDGVLDVVRPEDLLGVKGDRTPFGDGRVRFREVEGIDIWDGDQWTKLKTITATKIRKGDRDHALVLVEARAGTVCVTAHHKMLDATNAEVRADSLKTGDSLLLGAFPGPQQGISSVMLPELAELAGHLVADGYVDENGSVTFTKNDASQRGRVAKLWSSLFLGESREWLGTSGFSPGNAVGKVSLSGNPSAGRWIRDMIYTRDGYKKVPALVLNAQLEIQKAFLEAYYKGDGLKAGGGMNVKTNSPVLAQGLCWMYSNQGRPSSVYLERREGRTYYSLNLGSNDPDLGEKGQHLRKEPHEVRKIGEGSSELEWVFDFETESGVFMAGVGRIVVHNSPRRSPEFVTRKITRAVGRIKAGLQSELRLGNLDAKRDWGFAGDYVRAMWLMLQRPSADDYVVATGESHTIREFCQIAFRRAGLRWEDHVVVDPTFYRPAEVELLCGDASKARSILGWNPETTFGQLVETMVDHDVALAGRERDGRPA